MTTVTVELTQEELKYLADAVIEAEAVYRNKRIERAVVHNDPEEVPYVSFQGVPSLYFKLVEAASK